MPGQKREKINNPIDPSDVNVIPTGVIIWFGRQLDDYI